MPLQILLLAVGLALLLGGGDLLVRGASGLARSLGVPPLAIGLSVVAFGTSAPELAVNVLAAWSGNTEVSFGNIMGSNLANVGLVLAVAALIRPISITAPVIRREIPMMLLATAAAMILGADALLRGLPNSFDVADGALLMLLFCVFIYSTIGDVLSRRGSDEFLEGAEAFAKPAHAPTTLTSGLLVVLGLVALTGGGRLTVDAAVSLARTLGISEAVVGLTVIAVGTSLPELATSVMGARRGEIDVVVGNIVGSNIFNLLFVLAATSFVATVPIREPGYADMIAVAILSVLLLVMSINHQRQIVRSEGALLLALYSIFICVRALAPV